MLWCVQRKWSHTMFRIDMINHVVGSGNVPGNASPHLQPGVSTHHRTLCWDFLQQCLQVMKVHTRWRYKLAHPLPSTALSHTSVGTQYSQIITTACFYSVSYKSPYLWLASPGFLEENLHSRIHLHTYKQNMTHTVHLREWKFGV